MRIPGTKIEVMFRGRNGAAPTEPSNVVLASEASSVAPGDTLVSNSYADSVAAGLKDRFGSGGVRVNGRSTTQGYSAAELEEIYRGYIFAAIRKTRNKVADIMVNNIEMYDPTKGNPKDAPKLEDVQHPYLLAIDKAPVDNTLFYAGIASFMMILGEAFLDAGERTMVAGNIKPVDKFTLLQSNRVVRTYDDDGNLKTYKLTLKMPSGLDKVTHYLPTNAIALTDLNPVDLRKGYGMIRPVVDETSLETMATRLQIATLANMIKAPGVLSSKEKLEKDDYDELKHQVETRWTSNDMDKAGTPIVSNGGFIDYKSLIEDLDKMAMKEIRSLNRDAFFAVLGVSKTILGIEESGTTRDVSRTQTDNFILDTVMPLVNGIVSGLNQDYINNYPADYARKPIKMRAIAPISKDLDQEKAEAEINKQRAETFKSLVEAGLDPTQAAAVSGIELPDDATPIMVERKPVNTITLTAEQLAVLQRNGAEPAVPITVDNSNHSHVHHHDPADLAQHAKNSLDEKGQAKVEKAQNTLRSAVRELDTALGEQYIKSINQLEQKEQDAYIEKLANVLLTYYLAVLPLFGKARAEQMANDFEKEVIPFTVSDAVKQSLKERLTKVSNEHFQTIDNELTKIIAQGTRDNLSRADVIAAVREKVSNDVATWQVERLVDTESGNAFRQSTFFADKQFIDGNGFTGKAYKVWRTNSAKPCPFCTNTSGKRVPFEDNFFNVGDVAEGEQTNAEGNAKQVYYPVRFVDVNAGGLHPNCRCDYTLVIE